VIGGIAMPRAGYTIAMLKYFLPLYRLGGDFHFAGMFKSDGGLLLSNKVMDQ
jgi:hypothetical protein